MSRNPFNLYNPVDPDNDICNVAFSAYAKHTQEIEDIIDKIAEGDLTIELDDDFSDEELRYMEQRLWDEYKVVAHLSIN